MLWTLLALGLIGTLALDRLTYGPLGCPIAPEVSTYGKASWDWFPPGLRCTFGPALTGTGEARVDKPSAWRGVAIVMLAGGGLVLVGLSRSTRLERTSDSRPVEA